jgi:hypothetical protein
VIQSGTLRWDRNVARMEEVRSDFKILTGYPTGWRSLERPRCRWEDNIRIYRKEVGFNTWSCVDSVQARDYWTDFVKTH